MSAAANARLGGNEVKNVGGTVAAGTGLEIQGMTLDNTGGTLRTAGLARITGSQLTFDDGHVNATQALFVNGQSISNRHGTLVSGESSTCRRRGRIDNTHGTLTAGTDATIRANDRFTNADGKLGANGNVSLTGGNSTRMRTAKSLRPVAPSTQ